MPRKVGAIRSPRGIIGLVLMFRAERNAQLFAEKPELVAGGRRVREIRDRAVELARQSRIDSSAADELRQLAKRKRRLLLKSAASARFYGHAQEELLSYIANELLLAAADNRPVRPASATQQQWFRQIDDLLSGDIDSAFRRIADLQPALRGLEQEISNAALRNPAVAQVGSPAWADMERRINREISPLVGPDANVSDERLRSRRVLDVAKLHLRRIGHSMARPSE